MSRYRHVLEYITTHPWAIQRETLDAIVEVMRLRLEGDRLGVDDIARRLAAARAQQGARRAESFAGVIPIYGVIMPRANLMTEMSGGTTVDGIRSSFRALLNDDEVSRIVFDVDSPGGSVEGIPELAAEIRDARGVKPMSAVANYMMASAAYYIGSQADEVVASPSALVGSIGVYAIHEDWSAANEMMGIRPTYITAGKFKAEGNPDSPLSDEALAHIQESVDYSYDQFVAGVADARGVSKAAVRSGYGEGRVLDPEPARAAGLIDRIATLEEVLASKPPKMRAGRAADDPVVRRVVIENSQTPGEALGNPALDAELDELYSFEREQRERTGKRPITTAVDSAGAFLRRR
jgi:signal peptide peptidase SppA